MKPIYAISLLASILALGACEKQGPAEQMGEDLDDAANEVQQGAEEAGEEINNTLGN